MLNKLKKVGDVAVKMLNFLEKNMDKIKSVAMKVKENPKIYMIGMAVGLGAVALIHFFG